jgi:ribosomal protein S18
MVKKFKGIILTTHKNRINCITPEDRLHLDLVNITNNNRKIEPIIKVNRKIFSHLNFKSIYLLLGFFLDPQKQILSREETGLSSNSQRILKKTIKNARKLGILPYYKPLRYD